MLDLKFIRENPDAVRRGVALKGAQTDIDAILALDAERRRLATRADELKNERNKLSAEVGKRIKSGEPADEMLERFSFLDLYAGTAGVALEAASRGAGPVVAVERDPATAALARTNVRATGLAVQVVAAAVEGYLVGGGRPFDVVWFDPPYDVPNRVVERQVGLVAASWLAPDGLVVVERSARDMPFAWPDVLGARWHRRYGETTLYFATKEPA